MYSDTAVATPMNAIPAGQPRSTSARGRPRMPTPITAVVRWSAPCRKLLLLSPLASPSRLLRILLEGVASCSTVTTETPSKVGGRRPCCESSDADSGRRRSSPSLCRNAAEAEDE